MLGTHPWRKQPRAQLGHLPTPLEPLPRLSAELDGPSIWVKRDDCTGLAGGGNKTRKLELLLGDAIAQGADTIVTFGAVQSNHARQTAAACAKYGLACHQVLSQRVARSNPAYAHGGNVLLGKLLGAHQHVVNVEDTQSYTEELLAELKARGQQTYLIPAGGSNALGALGYATCAEELAQQCAALKLQPAAIVHASASAGTQAGLLFGLQQLCFNVPVLGVNVYHPDPAQLERRITSLLDKMYTAFTSEDLGVRPEVKINHAYFGEGYGQPTPECIDAIILLARLEGLLFDPVYSGKALAGLIDQINLGNFSDAADVILIHTGGAAALNVYEECFSD